MNSAHLAAGVTWAYALGFGLPAIPVAVYLLRQGSLPTFFGLFPMYGGPWSSRYSHGTFAVLLGLFFVVTLVVDWAAWRVWSGSRAGGMLSLALLPVEAVFWLGFALPIPWLVAVARVGLLILAWPSLR